MYEFRLYYRFSIVDAFTYTGISADTWQEALEKFRRDYNPVVRVLWIVRYS